MMKKLTLLLAITIACISTNAQNSAKEQEREIKISGNYYYGEGLGRNAEDAKILAIDDLKLMISEKAMQNNAEISDVDFKGFEGYIKTITLDLEGRKKVIAYIKKDELDTETSGEKQVFLIRATAYGPEIVEQNPVAKPQPKTIEIGAPTVAAPKSKEPEVITIVPLQPKQNESANKREITPASKSTGSDNTQQIVDVSAAAPRTVQSNSAAHPIINELSKLTAYEDARQLLNKYKSSGQLMYGQLATLSNPQNCYFMILKNREIVDILDKSSGSTRRSLLTGKSVDYKMVTDIVLWINIF